MQASDSPSSPPVGYSYLGPAGTFTEAALKQVTEAVGTPWRSVTNVGEALEDVVSGRSVAAMIAIENSVEGGVSATQDALARVPGLRIVGEYLVPVRFDLVARPGTTLDEVRTVLAHPVAYAQTHLWLEQQVRGHAHLPASSNVAAAADVVRSTLAEAAVAPHGIAEHYPVDVLASDIGDIEGAVTRFVLVSTTRQLPPATGADKTSVIAELPDNKPGRLLEMLEQFATRGVNMSLIESRPIGDALGRYRFNIDLDGHVHEQRVADALLGLKRFSPHVIFLGSYPRADRTSPTIAPEYDDAVFIEARDWLREIVSGARGED